MRKFALIVFALYAWGGSVASGAAPKPADVVLVGGKVVTLDADDKVAQAVAIAGQHIVAVGNDGQIKPYIGPKTKVIQLDGRMLVPGIHESHSHAIDVARRELEQPYAELPTIAEVQKWIAQRARQLPAGEWISVPRTDLTRIKERRYPTRAELDAASTTHPVIFSAAQKSVLNSLGFEKLGITDQTESIAGGTIVRDANGTAAMLRDGDPHIKKFVSLPRFSDKARRDSLEKVLRRYNEVGITSILDRGTQDGGLSAYPDYQTLLDQKRLTTRVTVTIFIRKAAETKDIDGLIANLGVKPGDGTDWIKPGPLKIMVDGGILWGTAYLRQPYGQNALGFYLLEDPAWRGRMMYSSEEIARVIKAGHRAGWQMSTHVTGDAGVDLVLEALAAADADQPVRDRRFTLIHAYFPNPKAIGPIRRLGVCVDTQPAWYYKDADALAEVIGAKRMENFVGMADWIKAGVPVSANTDHMQGMDPDHALNPFNPFLTMYVMVTRKTESGNVFNAQQSISRLEALRALTHQAAYLSFDEKKLGSLEPGKYADLAVLDRDVLTCPAEEIRDVKVDLTMVDGHVVYERRESR